MTKAQLIKDIQLAEARAWKEYRDLDAAAGRDSSITMDRVTRSRTQWATLYDLRETLGIPSMPPAQMLALGLFPEQLSCPV